MTNLLFVYATLRRNFGRHPLLRRLGAKWMGKASIRGELFDLGAYPGATSSLRSGAHVVGELYTLPDTEWVLKILDTVEGFRANTPQRGLFKRATVEVALPNKRPVIAWIYWLNQVSYPRRRIASGDYAKADHG